MSGPENADAPGLDSEQACHAEKQGALAGTAEAKQRSEARRRESEADIDQRPSRPIGKG
jgi:hypothetical protein